MNKKLEFEISMDVNHLPEKIMWKADDTEEARASKAIMLSIWDKKDGNTMRVDLWDKDFTTDEMKTFFIQSLLTMNDTLERATGDTELCSGIREFGRELGKRMGVIKE
ncbi:MAG: gliding motility-associated protein GldC [Patiriisocius sp.]|jgi:gliding motility-associated protein GldC